VLASQEAKGDGAAGACRLFEVRTSSLLRCNIGSWRRNILGRGKLDSGFAIRNAIAPADIGHARALVDRRKRQRHLRLPFCFAPCDEKEVLRPKNKSIGGNPCRSC
jgi:hypothetical protein